MMPKIQFDIHLFSNSSDTERSRKCLLWLLESLVQVDLTWLLGHKVPALYNTDILYKTERGTAIWKDISSVMRDKSGNCKDLATWRIAELRNIGINAKPYIKWQDGKGITMFHAVVLLPNGLIEDPSRALGMSDHPVTRMPVYIEP